MKRHPAPRLFWAEDLPIFSGGAYGPVPDSLPVEPAPVEAAGAIQLHAPDPACPYCHGSGTVYDFVDYGSTTVSMPSDCDCIYAEVQHA